MQKQKTKNLFEIIYFERLFFDLSLSLSVHTRHILLMLHLMRVIIIIVMKTLETMEINFDGLLCFALQNKWPQLIILLNFYGPGHKFAMK